MFFAWQKILVPIFVILAMASIYPCNTYSFTMQSDTSFRAVWFFLKFQDWGGWGVGGGMG